MWALVELKGFWDFSYNLKGTEHSKYTFNILSQDSSYLVVFTSHVILEQRDAFAVQPPVMSLPLKHRGGRRDGKRAKGREMLTSFKRNHKETLFHRELKSAEQQHLV